jgi:hypothetical protein
LAVGPEWVGVLLLQSFRLVTLAGGRPAGPAEIREPAITLVTQGFLAFLTGIAGTGPAMNGYR